MNRVYAYSLRLVCLCPLLLLLLAGPALAQTATPTETAAPTETAPPTATATATATPSPSATTPATATQAAATPRPTNTVEPAVPLPTATSPLATAAPTGGGLLAGDGLVPLLLGGLLLLAGLAILSLLLLRRRRPARAAPARASQPPRAGAPAPAPTVPLPTSAEQVTRVLAPAYLELESDPSQRFPIHGTPFAIGRDPDNALVIDEAFPEWQTVSRQHAVINRHERGYVIEDLGSQNGVRVNGRLTPKNLLRTGWPIAIGGVTFRFVDETQTN